MPELAKLVVSAMDAGTLESDPNREMPVDRIMAFAAGSMRDPLGGALLRAKFHGEVGAGDEALRILERRVIRPTESRRRVHLVCQRVMLEYLDELCRPCGGRGALVDEGAPLARHACLVCDGSGKRPVSVLERCNDLHLTSEQYARWEDLFVRAYRVIQHAEMAVMEVTAAQLGRRRPSRTRGRRKDAPA